MAPFVKAVSTSTGSLSDSNMWYGHRAELTAHLGSCQPECFAGLTKADVPRPRPVRPPGRPAVARRAGRAAPRARRLDRAPGERILHQRTPVLLPRPPNPLL